MGFVFVFEKFAKHGFGILLLQVLDLTFTGDSKSYLNGLFWLRSEKTMDFWHFLVSGGDIGYWLEMTCFWCWSPPAPCTGLHSLHSLHSLCPLHGLNSLCGFPPPSTCIQCIHCILHGGAFGLFALKAISPSPDTNISGGSKVGRPPSPHGPKFSRFHAVFRKI